MIDDQTAMQQALACAHSVEGRTSPRPPVGAVVVKDGRIVGQGATAPPYGPHAEVLALAQAGAAAHDSTLYVTLEPCCISVHTPPCTEAILTAQVRRVVVGTHDPNPRVCEQGVRQLREAGIEVTVMEHGVQAREAAELVQPFAAFIASNRPYVTAKWAMTLDGKLASHTGDSSWISGPDARSWVHDLRDRVDAVLVGAGTARMDDPQLTMRLTPEQRRYPRTSRTNAPVRVILTTRGDLPAHLLLLQPALADGTWIIVGEHCSREVRQRLTDCGVEVLLAPLVASGQIDIEAALRLLGQRGLMHVLIEGGANVLGSAFDQRCIQRIAAFVSPKLLGGDGAPSPLAGQGLASMQQARQLRNVRITQFDVDILIEGDISEESENRS
ncbi:MAG: bifunctional diaminohydroxyphosphoribosylaminopyrimidine deaminase/5-amino-6-(5-phosphoribosylamino)uracil reductase RibD [Ktedonobacteraceae bacterium]